MAVSLEPIPSLAQHRPDVPCSLDAVFQRMVAKRPEDRYQSMSEVISALRTCVGAASTTGGTSQSVDAVRAPSTGDLSGSVGTGLGQAAGSRVRTTSRPTIADTEETITTNLDNTNPGLTAECRPEFGLGSTPGSPRRENKTRWFVLGSLAIACLATLAWHLLPDTSIRGTNGPNQANGGGTSGASGAVVSAPPGAKAPFSIDAAQGIAEGTKAGDEWSGNSLAMKVCWCPPGEFKMGEAPNQVDVKLTRGFWMGKYEVTQAQWRKVMKGNPSHFAAAGWSKDAVAGLDTDNFPVELVGWEEATEVCRALSEQEQQAGRLPESWEYRLPTDAQWECACRAGTATLFSFGDVEFAIGRLRLVRCKR
jgi:formylglycine-generating enzyme required for sulfatase activity